MLEHTVSHKFFEPFHGILFWKTAFFCVVSKMVLFAQNKPFG